LTKFLFILILIVLHQFIIKIVNENQDKIKGKEESKSFTKKKEINFNKVYFWNTTLLKNEMHSYSLYNIFKLTRISLILIDDINLRLKEFDTIYQIINICNLNLTNIEIIFVVQNENENDFNLIKGRFPKYIVEKNIIKFFDYKGTLRKSLNELINLIEGTYTIFINNIHILKKLQITELLNYTKGKIDNYFNISITNELNTYLIRTKILKDFNDNGIKYKSIEHIFNIVGSLPVPHVNNISISLCPDNNYSRLAYVAMTSILSSKSIDTYICFYLIIPNNFERRNYNFLESLYEEYDYFNLTFIQIDNRYDKAYTSNKITIHAYYRFSLGELLKNLNKTIYIDTDTIVYKDLTNFYNINFDGKVILGQQTIGNRKGHNSINTGVLLMNLLEMRTIKFEQKVLKIIKKMEIFNFHDQTLLNRYFKKYIGFFPPEYHTRPWSNYEEIEIFNYKSGNIVDNDYLYFAHKYPTIRHFLGSYKPKNPNINYIEDWWFFARKSKYYNDSANSFEYAFSF
jgi:lipopolysaccharide biosynthesis glycosyltransferase